MKFKLFSLLKITFLTGILLPTILYPYFSGESAEIAEIILLPLENESLKIESENTITKKYQFYPNVSRLIKERSIASEKSLGIKIAWNKNTTSKYFDIVFQGDYLLKKVLTSINLLVWSGNYKASTLNFVIENDKGEEYLVSAGTLNFHGWKELIAKIPESITKGDGLYYPSEIIVKTKLKAIRVYISPIETKETIYIFFDHLRYFYKPTREGLYDGIDIEDILVKENNNNGTLDNNDVSIDDDDLE